MALTQLSHSALVKPVDATTDATRSSFLILFKGVDDVIIIISLFDFLCAFLSRYEIKANEGLSYPFFEIGQETSF